MKVITDGKQRQKNNYKSNSLYKREAKKAGILVA